MTHLRARIMIHDHDCLASNMTTITIIARSIVIVIIRLRGPVGLGSSSGNGHSFADGRRSPGGRPGGGCRA